MTDQPTTPSVTVDAAAVIQIIQQSHPDIVDAAIWQARAVQAEDRAARAEAERDEWKRQAQAEQATSTD